MAEKEIGERSRELLRATYELSRGDPARFVYIHEVAQEMGMGTVQYEKDREEFAAWARELEEAGYIERQGSGNIFFFEEAGPQEGEKQPMEEGYGFFSITDEGRRKAEEDL